VRLFIPPPDQQWRLVRVIAGQSRYQFDWYPPTALANTWNVSMRSVVAARERTGAPDAREAIAIGLLPPVTNGRAAVPLSGNHEGTEYLEWANEGDHACSDQSAVALLRPDGDYILGIACRVRPPCPEDDRHQLLFHLLNHVRLTDAMPSTDVHELEDDERSAAAFKAQLARLDEAMQLDRQDDVAGLIAELEPRALASPLSSLAVDLAAAEGWVAKRRAFDGDEAAAHTAIELLRRALDDLAADIYPESRRRALQWLAEAYAKRDAEGDLEHALRAYMGVVELTEEEDSSPLGWIALRMGVIATEAFTRLPEVAADRVRLDDQASTFFAAGRHAFETCEDDAGRIEIAVAEADSLRRRGGDARATLAAQRYHDAWTLMTVGGGMRALSKDRFETLGRHVWRAMAELDRRQFGGAPRDRAGWRARAVLLRPLTATRALMVPAPGVPGAVTLEMALSDALAPEVTLLYVGGSPHPSGADWMIATSDTSSWQTAVETVLGARDIGLMVPGYTPGMQWELRYLIERGLLVRSLLIMLPAQCDPEARDRWEGARAAAASFGLALPPYEAGGAFLRFAADRTVAHRLPFDALWQPRALPDVLADLLPPESADETSTVEDIAVETSREARPERAASQRTGQPPHSGRSTTSGTP
jgi:hypothetical protein